MTHVPILSTFLQIEVVVSTFLTIFLLAVAVFKKEVILSESARKNLHKNWPKFQFTFYIGFITMFLFLVLLASEISDIERGVDLRTSNPVFVEWVSVSLVFFIILLNLSSLYIIRTITGDANGPD